MKVECFSILYILNVDIPELCVRHPTDNIMVVKLLAYKLCIRKNSKTSRAYLISVSVQDFYIIENAALGIEGQT